MSERERRLKGELHSNDMSIESKIEWLLEWKKTQSSSGRANENEI